MPGAPFILCVVLIVRSCLVTAQAQAGLAPAAVFPYSEGAVSGLAREFLLFHCRSGLIGPLTSWAPADSSGDRGFNQPEHRWGVEC